MQVTPILIPTHSKSGLGQPTPNNLLHQFQYRHTPTMHLDKYSGHQGLQTIDSTSYPNQMPLQPQACHTNSLPGAYLPHRNWQGRPTIHLPTPHGLHDPRCALNNRCSKCQPSPGSKHLSGLKRNTQSQQPVPTQHYHHWLHRHSGHCPHQFTRPNSMQLSSLQY